MSVPVVWLAVGLILIVAELMTGTFYLLVLGLACLAGAAVSSVAAGFGVSAAVAAAVALFGLMWVKRYHGSRTNNTMAPLDVGQTVRWECWLDQGGRLARVSYRDAAWEALVSGEVDATPGEVLYITDVQGNRLSVSKRAP